MSVGTKQKLIQAAGQELVSGHGFFEMKTVAKRAGVSVGLAYHHFGSKAGLIAAVVEDFYDGLDRHALDLTFDESDWAGGERERIRRYVDFHYQNPLSSLMLGRLGAEPEVMEVESSRMERHIALGARNLARAQKLGQLDDHMDPELLTAMLLGGVRLGIETALKRPERPDFDALVDEIWGFAASAMRIAPSDQEEKEDVA